MTPFDTPGETRGGNGFGGGRHGDLERVFSKITQVDKSDNFVATKSEVKSRHTEAQASAPQ